MLRWNSRECLFAGAAVSVLASFGFASGARAQAAAATTPTAVEEVVVTGSFIQGTPKDAALPVSVIGAEDLQKQGSPNVVDVLKNLPGTGGILGDHNSYATADLPIAGIVTINLRNLGSQRTLVLVNGHRLANYPSKNGSVDVSTVPFAAIGRIEVLKDGAAATYGSDAIGGVVNFITRKHYDGLEVSGALRYVPGANDPDYETSVLFGKQFERGDILLSAGLQTRGRLRADKRSFNLPTYFENPDAGYSATNNPNSFIPVVGNPAVAPSTGQIRDPGCSTVGALAGFSGGAQACFARLAGISINLVDPTKRFQLYGETNYELSDDLKFHGEVIYGQNNTVGTTSPAFPSALGSPTGVTSPYAGRYYVPASNPGLSLLMQQFPGAFPAGTTGVVYASGLNFRPWGLGGDPTCHNQGKCLDINTTHYRAVAEFSGKIFDGINWNLSGTWDVNQSVTKTSDYLIGRMELALRGYGSLAGNPRCNAGATNNFTTGAGNNALGCYYFNPFSNNFARNSTSFAQNAGATNPLFKASAANPLELSKWLNPLTTSKSASKLFVTDLVINGQLPFFELPGGRIGWAAGGQFRRNFYTTDPDPIIDSTVTPCIDTPINGSTNCLAPIGPGALTGASFPSDVVQNTFAGFAELSMPITSSLNAHLAARYEDYGKDAGGSTFNPKLDVRWQVLDWLAFRGSVGTTFRGPPLTLIDPSPTVAVVSLANAFRAVFTAGNPDLKPETATTYSVGAIVRVANIRATVDYWNFDFKDPIVSEPAGSIFGAMFPNNTAVNCGNPAFANLQARFTFTPNVCSPFNVELLKLSYVNSGGVKTDGIDFDVQADFADLVMDGDVRVGGELTWTHKYDVAATLIQGQTVATAFNAVGKFNYNTGLFPLPKWKWNAYVEWSRGPHNLRIQESYISKMLDQRTTPFAGTLVTGDVATIAQATVTPRPLTGKTIKAFYMTDVTYRLELPWDVTATFNVSNVFDKDPPFARVELNYDPSTADALGRTYKVSVVKKF